MFASVLLSQLLTVVGFLVFFWNEMGKFGIFAKPCWKVYFLHQVPKNKMFLMNFEDFSKENKNLIFEFWYIKGIFNYGRVWQIWQENQANL